MVGLHEALLSIYAKVHTVYLIFDVADKCNGKCHKSVLLLLILHDLGV